MKAFGSLKCFNPVLSLFYLKIDILLHMDLFAYKYTLSTSGWLFIKFNNAFAFPDAEPPIINWGTPVLVFG